MNDDAGTAQNGWRTEAMYTFSEAARLAHVSTTTVGNWLRGYTVKSRGIAGRDVPPLFTSSNGAMVSFLQMIEIVVAARFRQVRRGVSFQTVRDAYENARSEWGLEYPFAHLKLEAMGGHIVSLMRGEASRPSLDSPQQWTLPGLIQETVDQLEYAEDELASRWFPVGRTIPIVIDPRLSAGLPVIDGRGVTVQAIRKRFKAGLRIEFIAEDFDMDRNLVETALQYWEQVAA